MQFHIGPWVYRVAISDGLLFDEDGLEVAGLCVWLDNLILISGTIPLERRADVLLHELRHAWQHHMGRPGGDEEDANSVASFAMMCITEFEAQGGERALMAMTPEPSPPPKIADGNSTRTWAQPSPSGGTECGRCGRHFSPGEIVTGTPEFHPLSGGMIVPRGVYCDGCGEVQEWHEGTLFDLTPNGQILGTLRRLRGTDAAQWLRRNGEQVGVVVA